MNELSVLFKSFDNLNLQFSGNMTPMIDIKFLIASENYTLAAHQLRQLIEETKDRYPDFKNNDKHLEVLALIHNVVVEKDKEHHRAFFEGLFGLIQKNLEAAGIDFPHSLFSLYGFKLNQPATYESFVDHIQSLQRKSFKHKEATVLFASQILATHQYLIDLESTYL